MVEKKKYEKADVEIIRLSATDVITTSLLGDGNDSDDGGWTGSKVW